MLTINNKVHNKNQGSNSIEKSKLTDGIEIKFTSKP